MVWFRPHSKIITTRTARGGLGSRRLLCDMAGFERRSGEPRGPEWSRGSRASGLERRGGMYTAVYCICGIEVQVDCSHR